MRSALAVSHAARGLLEAPVWSRSFAAAGPSRLALPNACAADARRWSTSKAADGPETEVKVVKRRGRPPRSTTEAKASSDKESAEPPERPRRRASAKTAGSSTSTTSTRSKAEPKTSAQKGRKSGSLMHSDVLDHSHLPPYEEWDEIFPVRRAFGGHRYFISNRNTAREVAASLGIDKLAAKGVKTTVIEAYPGPGIITRELLQNPNVEKVIVLEDTAAHLKWLDVLKEDPELGPKLVIIRASGYYWPSYNKIIDGGHLDHLKDRIWNLPCQQDQREGLTDETRWQGPSPLLFFGQLPTSVYGDQLYAQIIFAIAAKRWLFRFTRLRMAFTMNKAILGRITSKPDSRDFTRVPLATQCMTDVIPTRRLSGPNAFEPWAAHCFPTRQPIGARLLLSKNIIPAANVPKATTKLGIGLISLEPKKNLGFTAETFEVFEYLTRNLFVTKSQSISTSMK
ncbi:hypothetical protein OC845_004346 [Tilletia horrida]|nr:hypothetical protein OC845_004346 [Tilletia horrida]